MSHSIPKDALASRCANERATRDAHAPPHPPRASVVASLSQPSARETVPGRDAHPPLRAPPLPHRSFRAVYDAPGMRVTPRSRGYGVSMPFAAHAAAEPPSQLQATLVKSAKDVFAGTMGGIIVTVIGHPFDTVKVRPPARSSPPFARFVSSPIANPSPRARQPRVRTRRGGVPLINEPCVTPAERERRR